MENETQLRAAAVDSQLEVKTAPDNMQALLSCSPEFAADPGAVDKVMSRLKQLRIVAKPDLTLLVTALDEAKKSGRGITDLLFISGQSPEPSEDGKLEWTGDFFTDGYCIDPKTNLIDFHQKAGNPSVDENQLLVKVTRSRTGKNGRDLFGRAIVVPKPKDVTLRGGSNVVWDEAVDGFRAKCAGRVKLHGVVLDVDPVLVVKNGVGNESGNVKHNGKIIIDGDIEMDFRVEATGDIEIRGLAYASDIICGGNLAVAGGINGNPSKTIEVKGNILTKYLMNATIRSEGNILSNNEILHCQIQTCGEAGCHQGRVIGGEILATKGITVGEAGSTGNIPTLLTAGVDTRLQAELAAVHEEMERIKKGTEKLQGVYHSLEANMRVLNHAQKEKMVEIQYKILEGQEEIERLEQVKKGVNQKIRENGGAVIKILKVVYPGVVLRICDCQHLIKHSLAGPIAARLNRTQGKIELSEDIGGEDGIENES